MGLLVFILIVLLLAAWGILGFVLKVALGVALGVFFGVLIVGALIVWRVRRFFEGPNGRRRRVRGPGGSTVEVLDRRKRP
jgi:thiosulfate reductase cytochrome b subunit